LVRSRGLYIGKYPHPQWGISSNVIWGKNMKRGREKEGKFKKEERGKKKEERGKKIRKEEVKV
jgi:hypothetical protein